MKKTASAIAWTALGIAIGAGGVAVAQAVLPVAQLPTQGHVFARVDLGPEFPALQGYVLTLGQTTVPPGAGKGPHQHAHLPEIVHIVSGVLSDQRNGGAITDNGPGTTLVNANMTTHATLNRGQEPVVFWVANIRKADSAN